MIRAGVFIGVDRTGDLQELQDASRGAQRMHAWALTQGMVDGTHAKLITDSGGRKVGTEEIYDAIEKIVNGAGVDQLIVYFAGHGVNIKRNELWLLTEAPAKTSAAVNMTGSVDLARYCGIRHVVLISDACRVAPDGIRAGSVTGSEIFPNEEGSAQPVDQFFACELGRTAAEVQDPADAARGYQAIYTGAILDALKGARREVLEAGDDGTLCVRPARLGCFLGRDVPARLRELGLTRRQSPEARVMAHPFWLAQFEEGLAGDGERGPLPGPPGPVPETLQDVSARLLGVAVAGDQGRLAEELFRVEQLGIDGAEQLAATVRRLAEPFGPDRFDTHCGVKVRGSRIVDAFALSADAELHEDRGALAVLPADGRAANVLLRFENGVGTVVPAFAGQVAALTVEDGDLLDIAYEPARNTLHGNAYANRASMLRARRAVAAAAAALARVSVRGHDAEGLLASIQSPAGVDVTLAVHAAYALYDLQLDATRSVAEMVTAQFGCDVFDVALLSRSLVGRAMRRASGVLPFFPLLARGWSLLRAHRVELSPPLDGIERTLRDSTWSLFDLNGLDRLYDALRRNG